MNWQWTSIESVDELNKKDFMALRAIDDNMNKASNTSNNPTQLTSPFSTFYFLQALEHSGSVGGRSGWEVKHLIIKDHEQKLIAFMPGYIKQHSYGEYVFDHSWAHAYQQHGLDYYPKFVAGIPFTPVTGPRLLVDENVDGDKIIDFIVDHQSAVLDTLKTSSIHILFPTQLVSDKFDEQGFFQRQSVQFNWHNQQYQSFDEFLQSLTARRRRSIKKERTGIAKQNVTVNRLCGEDISEQDMLFFYQCYQQTYLKRSGHNGYLTYDFFASLLSSMPNNLLIVVATRKRREENDTDKPIASSLFLFDENGLYGRYWGALDEVSGLHFEACYYQGIEFCIERNIKMFNPGTQGEHKILRGFEPTLCYSNHKMREPAFDDAVRDFLKRETPHIQQYKKDSADLLPFKESN